MNFNEILVNDYPTVMVDGAVLVDVREPMEVAAGTLPGALNIPLGSLVERQGELDPAVPVVLLCRSGARSAQAAAYLTHQGYVNVTNLVGGMLAFVG